MNRVERIEKRLTDALDPTEILVKDQSHLHAGHAGAQDGMGHFEVLIVSSGFEGISRIARHRIVFDALGDMMQTDIHALKIRAYAPDER
ncbi:MAG: BolA family protein [Woeseiaceae bacterium]|nr:BolA family protein [Woeseiaceae bacterium]